MESEILERQLQDYFQAEVQEVEPSPEWWNKIVNQVESKSAVHAGLSLYRKHV